MRDEVARLRCYGSNNWAKQQAEYDGINTCVAAMLSFGGPKSCKFGCLGLGDCVRVCQFDAMHISDLGIVEIDVKKCTGCTLCIAACPKDVLTMYPREHRVILSCLTQERGKAVKDSCMVGCIQCQLCIKPAPPRPSTIAMAPSTSTTSPAVTTGRSAKRSASRSAPPTSFICRGCCPTRTRRRRRRRRARPRRLQAVEAGWRGRSPVQRKCSACFATGRSLDWKRCVLSNSWRRGVFRRSETGGRELAGTVPYNSLSVIPSS